MKQRRKVKRDFSGMVWIVSCALTGLKKEFEHYGDAIRYSDEKLIRAHIRPVRRAK